MLKKQLLILFVVIFWAQHSSCFVDLVFDLLKDAWKFINYLNEAKTTFETGSALASIFIEAKDQNIALFRTLGLINDKLDEFRAYTRDKQNYIELLIEQLPSEININSEKNKIVRFVGTTDGLWNTFISHAKYNCTADMLDGLIDNILKNIEIDLWQFRNILTLSPGTEALQDEGLFMAIIRNADKKRDILCDRGETSHHSVIRLFHVAIVTEIKAFLLLSFAKFGRYSMQQAWTIPLGQEFLQQVNRSLRLLSNAFTTIQLPYIRSCEPNVWQRYGKDVNFYEFEGYLQRTVYIQPLCEHMLSCDWMSKGQPISDHMCTPRPLNEHTKCSSTPSNCTSLDSETIVRPWKDGPHRIRCIKYGGKIYGTDPAASSCPLVDDGFQDNGFGNGQACACHCSQTKVKVMMELINSNINNNYIIVGARIRKVNDFIYIQIAEGKLEANGYISSFSWVPSTRRIHAKWGQNYPVYSGYKDEYVFFMEDLQVEPGHALIGIQFSRKFKNDVIGFGISINGMKFNYKTGKLRKKMKSLGTNLSDKLGSTMRALQVPGKNPLNITTHDRAQPNSQGYTHVYLRQSDLSHDYGQSTLPLFDAVPIVTSPLSPIGGVGLFHKGYSNYAGFLSLRFFPIDYKHYLQDFEKTNNLTSLLNLNA